MKFLVSSQGLLKKLQFLSGVVPNNSSIPILENFLFEIDGNQLKVTASDLETTMLTTLEIESKEKISIAVPSKLLLEILKSLPEQPLVFEVNDNNTIEIGSASGKYALAYADGKEFPKAVELQEPSVTHLPASVLSTAISKTIFATGNDDLRPVMTGVLFQFNTYRVVFVATDAHKLVKYERNDLKATQDSEFVVPKKPLNLLKSVLSSSADEVKIEYNEINAKFSFGDFTLVSRLINAKYPNYEAVIPKENPNKMVIGRNEFLAAVKRTSIFSNKETHQIRLKINSFDKSIELHSEDVNYSNKAEEKFNIGYDGEDLQIGFNSRFLSEMLSNLQSDEIQLEMSAPNRAGIISPVDGTEDGEVITMLVMPSLIS